MIEIDFPAIDTILLFITWLVSAVFVYFLYIKKPRYISNKKLLTLPERFFLLQLHSLLDSRYLIFSKVRLADILKPKSYFIKHIWWKAFTRVSSKHIDYLICDSKTTEILFAIELDDSSHNRADRKERDKFVNRAFKQANIPLYRISVQTHYDKQKLAQQLRLDLRNNLR